MCVLIPYNCDHVCFDSLPLCVLILVEKREADGLSRDLNPGPPAPKAGIIPLDH